MISMTIKHLVIGGCSETADGIGGCPPSEHSNGGCSYVDRGDGTRATPKSWAGFVAQALDVNSFVNVACSSAGNYYICQTLMEVLTRQQYPSEQTMVLFNVTEPGRLDVPCAFDHPDACKFVPYDVHLIPYSWLNRHSRTHDYIKKNMGIENVCRTSRTSLISLFSFLENRNLQYRFVTMHNYLTDPDLGSVLGSNCNRIDLDPGIGIVENSTINNTLEDPKHPNLVGHQNIAEQVLANLYHHV